LFLVKVERENTKKNRVKDSETAIQHTKNVASNDNPMNGKVF
jgi:hypothetical protein